MGTATRAVTVHVPAPLRVYAGGAADLPVSASSVRTALAELEGSHPKLYRCACNETGAVRRHINLFVNTDDVRDRDGPSWRSGIASLPWSATRDCGAWRFDGIALSPLGGRGKERGPERTLRPAQSLTLLRDFFLSRRDLDVFDGIAFPVLEKPGPGPAGKGGE